MEEPHPLRVLDFSTGIAGGYCTKLLVDAGSEVIKIEPEGGDPLRRWSATGADLGNQDGALFSFLNAGKRSLVGRPESAEVDELLATADLAVESFDPPSIDFDAWRRRFPALVVASISPYGRTGPWANRPASEFVVQAESGSLGTRGLPGKEPFQAGGRITEWIAGTVAAVASMAATAVASRTGRGTHVDVSFLEVMTYAGSNFSDLMMRLRGSRDFRMSAQSVETPSIEPTSDGFVGFCTNTAQQFSDFLLLVGRPDLQDDHDLFQVFGRMRRFDEWNTIVRHYTRAHSTSEIIEAAARLRIPVAPVNNGDTVRRHEHLVERKVFVADAARRFLQPRPPYRIHGEDLPSLTPSPVPALDGDRGRIPTRRPRERTVARENTRDSDVLPLQGVRVFDMTNWWAGPSAAHVLACLGADVIHLESIQHFDGMRTTGGFLRGKVDAWWEWAAFFLASNSNKRGLTLNLAHPRGLDIAKRLIARSDALIENFTPRVLDQFGLDWEHVRTFAPRLVMVRMPAFGLTGPWRDRPGFAQTMEQMTGMAWLTGHRDDQPRIQRGPCDPLAGMHAAFALLAALQRRAATGRGALVEVTMVEAALNAAAEQLLELTAYGRLMERDGNRSPQGAPQGLYACKGSARGSERWLALSVMTDAQWHALRAVLGDPAWAADPALAKQPGRHRHHDEIDRKLASWTAERDLDLIEARLLGAGVPAGRVTDPRRASDHPQLVARGFFETVDHPQVGPQPIPTLPFRYHGIERWIRTPAPTLGQHNGEILRELGLADHELDRLEAEKVIGTRPLGA